MRRRTVVLLGLLILSSFPINAFARKPIYVEIKGKSTPTMQRIADILRIRIDERNPDHPALIHFATYHIDLKIKPGIGNEGFEIRRNRWGTVIFGNDERGLLYGVGKFLHTSSSDDFGFVPSKWQGRSVPKKPVRGMYLATHFQNFYESAPIEDVKRYIEDLSLWGVNSYLVWFGIDAYNGIDDPKAQAMLKRLKALLKTIKDLGLNASLGCVANDAYKNSPVELRADASVGHDGYRTDWGPLYNLGPELCPSKPGVPELEVKYCQEKFDAFKSIGLDYWFIAPYDNGGCTCTQCAPWGVNGYLRMSELEAKAYKKAFPKGKVILSLWYFDKWHDGEWKGITDKFNANKPDWVDYVMVDDYGGKYPQYPLIHGTPGGLPMLNFPEISMYRHEPWGGYGANPLPKYIQSLWNVTKAHVQGGFPYSEGIYEDMNKVMVAQLYWSPNKPTEESMKEYIAYYFSPDVVKDVTTAIHYLEKNLQRHREDANGVTRFVMNNKEGAEKAMALIQKANDQLQEEIQKSWRWRVVYLRALIDNELATHEFRVTKKCDQAFQELIAIYHEQQGDFRMRPPSNLSGVLNP